MIERVCSIERRIAVRHLKESFKANHAFLEHAVEHPVVTEGPSQGEHRRWILLHATVPDGEVLSELGSDQSRRGCTARPEKLWMKPEAHTAVVGVVPIDRLLPATGVGQAIPSVYPQSLEQTVHRCSPVV